jgi:hypothetical protein
MLCSGCLQRLFVLKDFGPGILRVIVDWRFPRPLTLPCFSYGVVDASSSTDATSSLPTRCSSSSGTIWGLQGGQSTCVWAMMEGWDFDVWPEVDGTPFGVYLHFCFCAYCCHVMVFVSLFLCMSLSCHIFVPCACHFMSCFPPRFPLVLAFDFRVAWSPPHGRWLIRLYNDQRTMHLILRYFHATGFYPWCRDHMFIGWQDDLRNLAARLHLVVACLCHVGSCHVMSCHSMVWSCQGMLYKHHVSSCCHYDWSCYVMAGFMVRIYHAMLKMP